MRLRTIHNIKYQNKLNYKKRIKKMNPRIKSKKLERSYRNLPKNTFKNEKSEKISKNNKF